MKTVEAEVIPNGGQLSTAVLPRQPGPASLGKALALAQQRCRAVGKDATNTFHKYKYASSEGILVEAKDALDGTGLSVVPIEEAVVKEDGDYFLECKFLLLHESGESLPMTRRWPVCPEKGRPLDKATGATATLALAYLLRDLLLMPRVQNADEVNARRDEEREEQPEPPEPPKAPAKPPEARKEVTTPAGFLEFLEASEAAAAKKFKWAPGTVRDELRTLCKQQGKPEDIGSWDHATVRWGVEQINLMAKRAADLKAEADAEREKLKEKYEKPRPPEDGASFLLYVLDLQKQWKDRLAPGTSLMDMVKAQAREMKSDFPPEIGMYQEKHVKVALGWVERWREQVEAEA